MKTLAENLREHNLKVTPQRIAIYSYLTGTCIHPSVETIYNSIKPEFPKISLATVYKTVIALRNAGLIQEINVGEDSFRYDGCPDKHTHLICKKCHNVYDYKAINAKKYIKEINNQLGFDSESIQMFIYGVCQNCK